MTYPRIDGSLAATVVHVLEDLGRCKTSAPVDALLSARYALGMKTHDLGTAQVVASALAKLDRAIIELHNAALLLEGVGLEDELLAEFAPRKADSGA